MSTKKNEQAKESTNFDEIKPNECGDFILKRCHPHSQCLRHVAEDTNAIVKETAHPIHQNPPEKATCNSVVARQEKTRHATIRLCAARSTSRKDTTCNSVVARQEKHDMQFHEKVNVKKKHDMQCYDRAQQQRANNSTILCMRHET